MFERKGAGLRLLLQAMAATAEEAEEEGARWSPGSDAREDGAGVERLATWAAELRRASQTIEATTQHVGAIGAGGDPDLMLAHAHEYLTLVGHSVVAWMWLKQAVSCGVALVWLRLLLKLFVVVSVPTSAQAAASAALRQGVSGGEEAFYQGKVAACRYWFTTQLPSIHTLAAVVTASDDQLLTLREEWL